MPRIPTYDNFQIDPAGLPNARMNAHAVPTTATDQAQAMGRQMQDAGGRMGNIALQMQEEINRARVDDASNKIKEAALRLTYDEQEGYTALKGLNAMERPDGQPLDAEYGQKLQKHIDEIAGGLSNDAQRQAFMQNAGAISTSFGGSILQHMLGESKTYKTSVAEGAIDTAKRSIGLEIADPIATRNNILRIQEQVYRIAQLTGNNSAEWQDAKNRELIGAALATPIASYLDRGQVGNADTLLKGYGHFMDAGDLVKFRGLIDQQRSIQLGQSVGDGVSQAAYQANNPTEFGRLWQAQTMQESGGRQRDKNGELIVSNKGAFGKAQLMPATAVALARSIGDKTSTDAQIIQRAKDDPSYNEALGKKYMQDALAKYGGDVRMALASYNAGHGDKKGSAGLTMGLRKAAEWNKANPNQPRDWLEFMPAETRGYVANITAKLQSGSAAPKRTSELEVVQAVRSDPRLANDPIARKAAEETAAKNFKLQEDARKTQGDNALVQALEWGAQNQYRASDMPPSLRSQIPPERMGELQTQFEKLAKGDDQTDPVAYSVYMSSAEGQKELKGMPRDKAVLLAKTQFNASDGKKFLDKWGEANGAAPPSGGAANFGDIDRASFNATAESMLQQMGFNPSATMKSDAKEFQRVASIKYALEKQLLAMQQSAGKKFNDADMSRAISQLLSTTTKTSDGTTVPVIEVTRSGGFFGNKGFSIHKTTKEQLKAQFKAVGINDPSDDQLNAAYLSLKFRQVK